MGCGKIVVQSDKFNYITSLKERIITPTDGSVPEEGCKVPQRTGPIEIEELIFKPMDDISQNEESLNENREQLVKTYSAIKDCASVFYEHCHSFCVKNFRIVDGVIVMLISIAACNEGNLNSSFSFSYPRFHVDASRINSGTKEFYEAWKRLELKIHEIMVSHIGRHVKLKEIENITEQFEEIFREIEHLDSYKNSNGEHNKKVMAQGILLGKKLKKESTLIHNAMNDLISQLKVNKTEIEKYAKIAAEKQIFSADRIIHEVLAENYLNLLS